MKVRSEFSAGQPFHCDLAEMLDMSGTHPTGQFHELTHIVSLLVDLLPISAQKHVLDGLLQRCHLTLVSEKQ